MEKRLTCAMDIGEEMLLSGAEVHRVEESLRRMCAALGAARTDVFIITSSMVVTVFDAEGHSYTQTRRILSSTTDFEKLHRLNSLCRRICETAMSVDKIQAATQKALTCKTYPGWLNFLCSAGIAGAFTLFFGGDAADMLVSLFTGAMVQLVGLLLGNTVTNRIFSRFLSSAVAAAFAFLAVGLGLITTPDKVIIGNIMTLIPGIGLTNALRDLFTGDSIAGLLRAVEAVLIALAIAAGYFLIAFVGGALL